MSGMPKGSEVPMQLAMRMPLECGFGLGLTIRMRIRVRVRVRVRGKASVLGCVVTKDDERDAD